MNITPKHIEAAAKHLMGCSALGGRNGILINHFIEGDAWYDQGPLAVSFGLDPFYEEQLHVVYSYLGLIFFLAAESAVRAGLGRLEGRDNQTYFVLTKEGRIKFPWQSDGEPRTAPDPSGSDQP